MNIDLNKYKLCFLKDCNDGQIYDLIALNRKHKTKDFQDAINKAKEKHEKDIDECGNDWYWIEQELNDFDYYIVIENIYNISDLYY